MNCLSSNWMMWWLALIASVRFEPVRQLLGPLILSCKKSDSFIRQQMRNPPSTRQKAYEVIADKTNFGSVERSFEKTLSNLTVPPHQYFVRAYLKYDETYVYSPQVERFQFGDGWQKSDQSMPMPLWSHVAANIGGEIYLGIGCPAAVCDESINSTAFWKYDPESGES